jgi:hypothetical protein
MVHHSIDFQDAPRQNHTVFPNRVYKALHGSHATR